MVRSTRGRTFVIAKNEHSQTKTHPYGCVAFAMISLLVCLIYANEAPALRCLRATKIIRVNVTTEMLPVTCMDLQDLFSCAWTSLTLSAYTYYPMLPAIEDYCSAQRTRHSSAVLSSIDALLNRYEWPSSKYTPAFQAPRTLCITIRHLVDSHSHTHDSSAGQTRYANTPYE